MTSLTTTHRAPHNLLESPLQLCERPVMQQIVRVTRSGLGPAFSVTLCRTPPRCDGPGRGRVVASVLFDRVSGSRQHRRTSVIGFVCRTWAAGVRGARWHWTDSRDAVRDHRRWRQACRCGRPRVTARARLSLRSRHPAVDGPIPSGLIDVPGRNGDSGVVKHLWLPAKAADLPGTKGKP